MIASRRQNAVGIMASAGFTKLASMIANKRTDAGGGYFQTDGVL